MQGDNVPDSEENSQNAPEDLASLLEDSGDSLALSQRGTGEDSKTESDVADTIVPESLTSPNSNSQEGMSEDPILSIVRDLKVDTGTSEDVSKFCKCVSKILREHSAYSVMPASGKVVVFDSELTVRHAFAGLVEHDIKCAPVWNSARRDFMGMITVTDFIDILLRFYNSEDYSHGNFANRLGEYTVEQWNDIKQAPNTTHKRLLHIRPDQSLFDGVRLLSAYNVHRLPVLERQPENRVLSILNHQRILRFVINKMKEDGTISLLRAVNIGDLCVGTLGDSCSTVPESAPLIDVLLILKKYRLPAVPILSREGKYAAAYSRSDVRFLAIYKTYDRLDMSVKDALEPHQDASRIPQCHFDTPLLDVFETLLCSRKHAVVILDEYQSVLGILSLAEVFQFILEDDCTLESREPLGVPSSITNP